MTKQLTERELTPLAPEPIDPMDVVRCVEQFRDIDTDKLMTIKFAFAMSHLNLYNIDLMTLAIDEVIKSRLNAYYITNDNHQLHGKLNPIK